MRKKGIPEQYVAIIQDMYNYTQTSVNTRSDTTEYFDIEVGLHQGSALIPLLFIIVMDVLASEVGTRPPWGLLFADDLAICAESSTEVEDELEKWRANSHSSPPTFLKKWCDVTLLCCHVTMTTTTTTA